MSKYKVKFYAYIEGKKIEEIVDLREKYSHSIESAVKAIFEDRYKMQGLFEEWLRQNIDAGWKRLEEE